jgi:voltage-gated potassium channel
MQRRHAIAALLRRGLAESHEESTRKHLVLLIALIVTLVGQPLIAGRSGLTKGLLDGVLALTYLGVLFAVFGERRRRTVAAVLFLPTAGSHVALYTAAVGHLHVVAVAFHFSAIAFLSYAVAAVLHDLFGRTVINGDDVLGAVCGYILAALAWAHLYGLVYMFQPHAFSVSPNIAAQLDDVHLRMNVMNYFSLTTLMTIGYNDITPVGSPAYSLMWIEVLFGQFYMAVVVAQLVGLKLAQAMGRDDHPH